MHIRRLSCHCRAVPVRRYAMPPPRSESPFRRLAIQFTAVADADRREPVPLQSIAYLCLALPLQSLACLCHGNALRRYAAAIASFCCAGLRPRPFAHWAKAQSSPARS